MFKYFKAEPTEFVRVGVKGKTVKEGNGIAKFYFPFRTTIELVSTSTEDQPFTFQEITEDRQEVNLQGGFIYRIENPKLVLGVYNLSIDPKTKRYLSEDTTKIPEYVLQIVRGETRKVIQQSTLERILVMSEELSERVSKAVIDSNKTSSIGIKFEQLYFESVKPRPEIAKALEANYRESLLQKADEAIFARRALAVEKERAIKENEMATLIEMEQKRADFVRLQGENTLKEADYKAQATKKAIEVYKDVDPAMVTAQALLKIGEDAKRIENLTITPEIFAGLLNRK